MSSRVSPVTTGGSIELTDPKMPDWEVQNLRRRQQMFQVVQTLAPLPSGSGVAGGIMAPGVYKGGKLAADARVHGYGFPLVQGRVTVQSNATINGVVFVGEVVLEANAAAVFVGCTFLNSVTMASGAVASFTGCRFDGNGSVQNAGSAERAQIVGGVKTSGVSDANATVVGQVQP